MAKSDSILGLRGTFGDMTFVKSRTYGEHVRAPGGTHTKAEVNDALKKESQRLVSANVAAKIFKDAIDPYRNELTDGQLWQRLISMFHKQLKVHGSFDFSNIQPFEIHSKYTFGRFLHVQPTITADKKRSVLHVDIRYDYHPQFPKASFIDGYQLTIIVIFPDLKKKTSTTTTATSSVIGLTGTVSPVLMAVDIPPKAKQFIVCIKIDGCSKGVVTKGRTTKGLRVVGGGMN